MNWSEMVSGSHAARTAEAMFTMAAASFTTAAAPFFWRAPSVAGWALFALSGIMYGVAHFCMILAYVRAPASDLAPMTYVQIIAATVFGFLVFGDLPDGPTVQGDRRHVHGDVDVRRHGELHSQVVGRPVGGEEGLQHLLAHGLDVVQRLRHDGTSQRLDEQPRQQGGFIP